MSVPGRRLLLLLLALAAGAALAQPPRPLQEVLNAFEDAGYSFVYSRDLVRPSTMVEVEAPLSIAALQRALEKIGLTLERTENGDGRVTWYVVPRQVTSPPSGIEGRITDAASGEPLAGVKVEIAGQVAFTDASGRFRLSVQTGPPLTVSRTGYQPRQVTLDERLDELLEISLEAQSRIEEVVVVSSRYALEQNGGASVHTLSARDLGGIPEFGDDALRAVNQLPGTAGIGLSARPYIRGGLPDETLVLFNNVELLEPFHLKDFQSVFSGFNPSLVKSIDVYTGGFPARYGDRMSGVMDIKPADEIGGFGADVMLSFLTASAAFVGTSQDGRGRWALSARRGNLDLVLDVLDPDAGTPKYSDYFGSFSYALNPVTEIEAGFIFYDDDVELKDVDEGDGELAHSVYRNGYAWLQLHRQWSERVDSSTVLSYGSIENDRDGFINDEDLEEGSSSLTDRRHFELVHLAHRQHIRRSDSLAFELGGRFSYQQGRYETLAVIERGVLAELIGIPVNELRVVDERPDGTSGGLYGSVRYLPRDWLSLEAGLRWDYQDYAGSFASQGSPRFSALVNVSPRTELRLSLGRFHQAEQIQELQAADGVSEFQPAQYADHYILGLEHAFGASGLSMRFEAFHKRFQRPKRRHENLFNSLILMPELASDRVAVSPDKARARGLELTLAWEPSPTFDAWLTYTHAYADDEIAGEWVKRGWDQRHTVGSGLIWEHGSWSFSTAVLWHSGWQTTVLPPAIGEDELPALTRNADRLPDYLSLDLRVSRTWRWPRQSLVVFLELTNALDRENVGAYEYDVEENEEEGGYNLPREPVTLLPRIPSLGVRWTFD